MQQSTQRCGSPWDSPARLRHPRQQLTHCPPHGADHAMPRSAADAKAKNATVTASARHHPPVWRLRAPPPIVPHCNSVDTDRRLTLVGQCGIEVTGSGHQHPAAAVGGLDKHHPTTSTVANPLRCWHPHCRLACLPPRPRRSPQRSSPGARAAGWRGCRRGRRCPGRCCRRRAGVPPMPLPPRSPLIPPPPPPPPPVQPPPAMAAAAMRPRAAADGSGEAHKTDGQPPPQPQLLRLPRPPPPPCAAAVIAAHSCGGGRPPRTHADCTRHGRLRPCALTPPPCQPPSMPQRHSSCRSPRPRVGAVGCHKRRRQPPRTSLARTLSLLAAADPSALKSTKSACCSATKNVDATGQPPTAKPHAGGRQHHHLVKVTPHRPSPLTDAPPPRPRAPWRTGCPSGISR